MGWERYSSLVLDNTAFSSGSGLIILAMTTTEDQMGDTPAWEGECPVEWLECHISRDGI